MCFVVCFCVYFSFRKNLTGGSTSSFAFCHRVPRVWNSPHCLFVSPSWRSLSRGLLLTSMILPASGRQAVGGGGQRFMMFPGPLLGWAATRDEASSAWEFEFNFVNNWKFRHTKAGLFCETLRSRLSMVLLLFLLSAAQCNRKAVF